MSVSPPNLPVPDIGQLDRSEYYGPQRTQRIALAQAVANSQESSPVIHVDGALNATDQDPTLETVREILREYGYQDLADRLVNQDALPEPPPDNYLDIASDEVHTALLEIAEDRDLGSALFFGDNNDEVQNVQAYLNAVLPDLRAAQFDPHSGEVISAPFDPLVEDGLLGPLTASAVREFQRSVGLPATGLVDEATLLALRSAYTGDGDVFEGTSDVRASGFEATTATHIPIGTTGYDVTLQTLGNDLQTLGFASEEEAAGYYNYAVDRIGRANGGIQTETDEQAAIDIFRHLVTLSEDSEELQDLVEQYVENPAAYAAVVDADLETSGIAQGAAWAELWTAVHDHSDGDFTPEVATEFLIDTIRFAEEQRMDQIRPLSEADARSFGDGLARASFLHEFWGYSPAEIETLVQNVIAAEDEGRVPGDISASLTSIHRLWRQLETLGVPDRPTQQVVADAFLGLLQHEHNPDLGFSGHAEDTVRTLVAAITSGSAEGWALEDLPKAVELYVQARNESGSPEEARQKVVAFLQAHRPPEGEASELAPVEFGDPALPGEAIDIEDRSWVSPDFQSTWDAVGSESPLDPIPAEVLGDLNPDDLSESDVAAYYFLEEVLAQTGAEDHPVVDGALPMLWQWMQSEARERGVESDHVAFLVAEMIQFTDRSYSVLSSEESAPQYIATLEQVLDLHHNLGIPLNEVLGYLDDATLSVDFLDYDNALSRLSSTLEVTHATAGDQPWIFEDPAARAVLWQTLTRVYEEDVGSTLAIRDFAVAIQQGLGEPAWTVDHLPGLHDRVVDEYAMRNNQSAPWHGITLTILEHMRQNDPPPLYFEPDL